MKFQGRIIFDLDMVAGLATGALLLMIALVVVIGMRIGIRITAQLPPAGTLGPYGALTFVFSEPVDETLAIERFSIQPVVQGKFEWFDSKTLRFLPAEPYQPDTIYTLAFTPGLLTQSSGALKIQQSWKFQIRQPLIVYLVIENGRGRLWTIGKTGGPATPLIDATFKLYGFDASHDGEFVIFSAFNDQNGMDLWRVNRTGGNALLLLQCGADRCSAPAISPDHRRVAYVREAVGPTPDLPYGAPRIWVFDLDTNQDSPLYEDRQLIGIEPEWSPDGTRLSSYDGIKDEFRLLDLMTGGQTTITSQTGGSTTWSTDGSTFVYTDVDTNEFGTHSRIREAKLTTKEITTLFGEKDEREYNYNSLAWSPTENVLVIGLRPNDNDPSEALWLMKPATLDGQSIVDQPGYIYSNPIWDPWGKAVLFQQFKLKAAYKPEIGLWLPDMQAPIILAGGTLPEWLP